MKNGARYSMSKKMFDAIVKDRKGEDKKKNPFAYVLEVINHEFGLKNEVTSISING